jgi:hypothetical protein
MAVGFAVAGTKGDFSAAAAAEHATVEKSLETYAATNIVMLVSKKKQILSWPLNTLRIQLGQISKTVKLKNH